MMTTEGIEPGQPGDENSANRCVTYSKEWIPLRQLCDLKGMSKNGLMYRLKKLDGSADGIRTEGAGIQRRTLVRRDLAEKVMSDGQANQRAPKTARELLAMPKEKRKAILKRNAKRFMEGVKSGEFKDLGDEPGPAPAAVGLDIDREKVKAAVDTLRDWVAKAQKALDILSGVL